MISLVCVCATIALVYVCNYCVFVPLLPLSSTTVCVCATIALVYVCNYCVCLCHYCLCLLLLCVSVPVLPLSVSCITITSRLRYNIHCQIVPIY